VGVSSSFEAVFFFDLGVPECYLAAERIISVLQVVPEWEPVLGSEFEVEPFDREEIALRAAQLSLLPLRWPSSWPPETLSAMLAATYAKQIGRAVAYSLAAFRQTFAAGRELGDENTVLLAAAAAEMHPTAVLKGIRTRSVTAGLSAAGDRARAAGVRVLPSIAVGARTFSGARAVELAAGALARAR
jgi:2-hydroxychromene-2-carboxylate isomerase